MEVWFRSCSFLSGWFVGSMLIFQGVGWKGLSVFFWKRKTSMICYLSWCFFIFIFLNISPWFFWGNGNPNFDKDSFFPNWVAQSPPRFWFLILSGFRVRLPEFILGPRVGNWYVGVLIRPELRCAKVKKKTCTYLDSFKKKAPNTEFFLYILAVDRAGCWYWMYHKRIQLSVGVCPGILNHNLYRSSV